MNPKNENARHKACDLIEGVQAETTIKNTAQPDHRDNSTKAQRSRLLDWLIKNHSISTIDARRYLDIMMPAARVHELRHKFGYHIETIRVWQDTEVGRSHWIAKYVLFSQFASEISHSQQNYSCYERRKQQWLAKKSETQPKQYEQAMHQIASECGV